MKCHSSTTERHTAHQQRPAEVTIHYSFHPLRTQSLPVIRQYDLDDETYYVVRRADGRPLAVPAWMTHPGAAYAKIVSTARLPVRVLHELRRLTVTCLVSPMHNVNEENHDAKAPSKTPKTALRRTSCPSPRETSTRCAGAATPGDGAVDFGAGQSDPRRGER